MFLPPALPARSGGIARKIDDSTIAVAVDRHPCRFGTKRRKRLIDIGRILSVDGLDDVADADACCRGAAAACKARDHHVVLLASAAEDSRAGCVERLERRSERAVQLEQRTGVMRCGRFNA